MLLPLILMIICLMLPSRLSQAVLADGLLRAAADLIWRDAVGGGVYFSAREDDGDHHLVCMQAQFFVVFVDSRVALDQRSSSIAGDGRHNGG